MDNTDERLLTLDRLFEAAADPEAEEMPPHPQNRYEIAEGVVAGIKRPTMKLQKEFDAAFEPLHEVIKTSDQQKEDGEKEDGETDLDAVTNPNRVELKDGHTVRDFRALLQEIAAKQCAMVLSFEDLDEPPAEEDFFAPMTFVVQDHFTALCRGIGRRPGASSAETKRAA